MAAHAATRTTRKGVFAGCRLRTVPGLKYAPSSAMGGQQCPRKVQHLGRIRLVGAHGVGAAGLNGLSTTPVVAAVGAVEVAPHALDEISDHVLAQAESSWELHGRAQRRPRQRRPRVETDCQLCGGAQHPAVSRGTRSGTVVSGILPRECFRPPLRTCMPNHVQTLSAAETLANATVGTGIGGLRGWGAALTVVVLLAGVAWWASRRGHR